MKPLDKDKVIIDERKKELEWILVDLDYREKELLDKLDKLQADRRAIKKEIYLLSGEAQSTPLFLRVANGG